MNCVNCGAAMELIESRRYFRCRHCGTYHFPEAIEVEGIRIVGQAGDAPACPVCSGPMAHAILDGEHPIDFCANCRGILLPRADFGSVTSKRRAWATSPPAEPVAFQSHELKRRLTCPRCHGPFDTYPHLGPGNVVIDNCTRCDLIWLDFGELRQIVDAPGRDRGSRHTPGSADPPGGRSTTAVEPDEAPRRSPDMRPAADALEFLFDLIFDK